MTNWKYRINLKKEWQNAKDGKLTAHELGEIVATKIKKLPVYNSDVDLQYIADNFENLGKQSSFDDFDIEMEDLYNWADYNHRCRIATF